MEHQHSKHNSSIFEIPLDEAEELTKAWAERGNFIKAFLIDASELKDMITERKAAYVRVYFGWDKEMELGREQRLIMVPVDEYGRDMVNTGVSANLGEDPNSNVFDFSMPCPPTCAPDSPLSQ